MKKLMVLRHAKSSWEDDSLEDHDRPLNDRGEREAPRVGEHMKTNGLIPSTIVSSTALRTKQTARAVAKECGIAAAAIIEEPRLYHAAPSQILEVIRAFPETWQLPLIVGHNPSAEELVSALTREDVEMKTAALAVIELDLDLWRNILLTSPGRLAMIVRGREL